MRGASSDSGGVYLQVDRYLAVMAMMRAVWTDVDEHEPYSVSRTELANFFGMLRRLTIIAVLCRCLHGFDARLCLQPNKYSKRQSSTSLRDVGSRQLLSRDEVDPRFHDADGRIMRRP